jgi:tubulin epsilon
MSSRDLPLVGYALRNTPMIASQLPHFILIRCLGELFDYNQFVRSVSGAGNNWAHGHCVYGPQHAEDILESIRTAAERCDSLQSFFIMHSLGGGTGSGLGSYLLPLLEDAFPHAHRFNVAVCPAPDDDVITSPYNSVLALEQLRRHSDCVLPVDNAALMRAATRALSAAGTPPAEDKHPYDAMNTLVGQTLTALTAPIRFPGALNVDLNELTMNLVPFPAMHFVLPSLAPISFASSKAGTPSASAPRNLDQLFMDALRPEHCLLSVSPAEHAFLALGVFMRGKGVHITDVNRNIARLKTKVYMVPWNPDGFKVGLCTQPGVGAGMEKSVLMLSNNCAVTGVFKEMLRRFDMLYRRRAHVHHYTQVSHATLKKKVFFLFFSYTHPSHIHQFPLVSPSTVLSRTLTRPRRACNR